MSFRSIMRELKGMGSMSKRGSGAENNQGEGIQWSRQLHRCDSQEVNQDDRWTSLPSELLLDVIQRIEASEVSWIARRNVLACAAVCRSWREITKEVVTTPEQCGRITFPISLKQPGPRENPIQCFIKRDRTTSTFRLYLGLSPSLHGENDKLLLAARKVRRATSTDFVISLSSNDFSRASSTYIGKLRSSFLGTKFTVYDSQPPYVSSVSSDNCSNRRIRSKQVSPRVPVGNYSIATIAYELNVLRTRGPRRMQCCLHSIPVSSIQEGGSAPTPSDFSNFIDDNLPHLSIGKGKGLAKDFSSTSLNEQSAPAQTNGESLILKNKAPRWHEQLQCWCLNFRGRVTVASVKNFQLVAAVEPSHLVPPTDQEKVILQFGKIGKDIFTMDYRYPLSAFQAFAICLTSFDTKPACE